MASRAVVPGSKLFGDGFSLDLAVAKDGVSCSSLCACDRGCMSCQDGKVSPITGLAWDCGKQAGNSVAALISGDTTPGRAADLQGDILS